QEQLVKLNGEAPATNKEIVLKNHDELLIAGKKFVLEYGSKSLAGTGSENRRRSGRRSSIRTVGMLSGRRSTRRTSGAATSVVPVEMPLIRLDDNVTVTDQQQPPPPPPSQDNPDATTITTATNCSFYTACDQTTNTTIDETTDETTCGN